MYILRNVLASQIPYLSKNVDNGVFEKDWFHEVFMKIQKNVEVCEIQVKRVSEIPM